VQKTAFAKLKHYSTAQKASYEKKLQLSDNSVKAMLKTIEQHTDIIRNNR